MNNKGFSLVEILMSMAVLGIALLGFMELRHNSANSEVRSDSHIDYVQLNSEFLLLIDKDENCTASLANPTTAGVIAPLANRVSFNASNIEGSSPAQDLQIELWTGTSGAIRSRRKMAADVKYGNIIIDSVRLYLPDHNTGDFMTAGTRSIQAEILLEGRRKITTSEFQAITPIRKLVSLNIENDGSGSSSIIGCGEIHEI